MTHLTEWQLRVLMEMLRERTARRRRYLQWRDACWQRPPVKPPQESLTRHELDIRTPSPEELQTWL